MFFITASFSEEDMSDLEDHDLVKTQQCIVMLKKTKKNMQY